MTASVTDPATSTRPLFAIALLADLIGSVLALLVVGRTWQTVTVSRARPLIDDVDRVTGHSLDAAVTGLAVVGLAGVVAVLATRGLARRLIGALLALAGVFMVWRAGHDLSAVSATRGRSIATSGNAGVGIDSSSLVRVTVSSAWPLLAVMAGLLIAIGGLLVTLRGGQWSAMSSRYEAPAAAVPTGDEDVVLWRSLDQGEDPTRT